MARPLATWQQIAIDTLATKGISVGTSQYSIRRMWTYVMAFVAYTLDVLFDWHKQQTDEKIAAMKPHSEQWYAGLVKRFRYGQNLLPDSDEYDNSGLTDEDIIAMQIVKQSAVQEQKRGIRIKVATLVGTELGALSSPQMDALLAYIKRVKDAGVKITLTTGPADALKMKLLIKYNPLVLNALGQRIDGTDNEPVQNAVKNYLENLPFNGNLELDKAVDQLQGVEGVSAAYITSATARYGLLPFASFPNYLYVPDAGYIKFYDPADLTIEFVVNG